VHTGNGERSDILFDIKRAYRSGLAAHPDDPLVDLSTPWGAALGAEQPLSAHPRPQMRRESYINLNGIWEYAIVPACQPQPEVFEGTIRVPFSPESALSGVGCQLAPDERLWYRRTFTCPELREGQRLLLHFEAVDHAVTCMIDGVACGTHEGGYLPFYFELTDRVHAGTVELAVGVRDPSDTGTQPRGKQKLARGTIWYTAQSGIWQTVWLEVVPAAFIAHMTLLPDADAGTLTVNALVSVPGGKLSVAIRGGSASVDEAASASDDTKSCDAVVSAENCAGRGGEANDTWANGDEALASASTAAPMPLEAFAGSGAFVSSGVGTVPLMLAVAPENLTCMSVTVPLPNPHRWSPDDPFLYPLTITYAADSEDAGQSIIVGSAGAQRSTIVDRVESYCAFRTFTIEPDARGRMRFCCNHEPLFLRGLLDQGYWSDGLLTAPSDEALVADIRMAKDLGFNLLRKHIKVESERWYYHCDRLGMVVWQDMVSGGGTYAEPFMSHLPTLSPPLCALVRDTHDYARFGADDPEYRAHWLAHSLGVVEQLRNHPCIATWVIFNEGWGQFDAAAVTEAFRAADPTRLLDQASGWYDQGGGDFASVHNYFRTLTVPGGLRRRAGVISEFGGLALHVEGHSAIERVYGYQTCADTAALQEQLTRIMAHMDALEEQGLSGYVYTQLSDVEEEVNGLVTYDRQVVKVTHLR